MKLLSLFIFFPVFFSLQTEEPKQVTFLPLKHTHQSTTSFKQKNQLKQDTVIVYTPVDEITSVVVSYPCDIVYSPYYDLCSTYLTCGSCLASPYCGWCSSSMRCLPGTVSQVACPSSCVSTWLFTDYNSICSGTIVTQSITEAWITPTVVSSVDTVYHTSADNVVYVQIGTRETIVMDENMNEVIESVPIYAEYHESVPIGQIETRYYTLSPTIVDSIGNNTNSSNSSNATNSPNQTNPNPVSNTTDQTLANTSRSADIPATQPTLSKTTNQPAPASPTDNTTTSSNNTPASTDNSTNPTPATDTSTANNTTDNSTTNTSAAADNGTSNPNPPSGFLTKSDKTAVGSQKTTETLKVVEDNKKQTIITTSEKAAIERPVENINKNKEKKMLS